MQTVLVTGANRGLGLEFCQQYANDGWRVLACCRKPLDANVLRQLSARYPDRVTLHALDVADHTQIARLGQKLANQPIDLLLNNAGVYPDADKMGFGHTDYQAWALAFRVNTMATLLMAEAFIRNIDLGDQKIIATVASKMGSIDDNTSGGHYLYRSSKTAVNMVIKSLAIDLAPRGVRAVTLHPGWVLTDMGGPNALISAEQSVTGMRRVLAQLSSADSGRFIGFDGKEISW
jgi:NAD(P)-dependent dehydrogenase (short-subunit alcohol dehydrogenase family)